MATTDAGQDFYSALQSKALSAVGDATHATLYPVQYPAQGDFAWNWQNPSQVFNDATYQYVDALAAPGKIDGTVALSTAGGFANAYVTVLKSIVYKLSQADQQTMNDATSNAALQGGTLVSDYQNTLQTTITPAQMAAANVTNPIDYILNHVLGAVWSGANPPLTWQQMASARDLRALLPNAPASADTVLTDVSDYLNLMAPALGLASQRSNGTWMLSQLIGNSTTPTVSNGGMPTFNPGNGTTLGGCNVGWQVNAAPAAIADDLANTKRTISLAMSTSSSTGSALEVSVEGAASVAIDSWLSFSTAGGGSYDMSTAEGTSTDCSVEITFAGYSLVPVQPTSWQQATDTGFYWADPIEQAVANRGRDVTGYAFLDDPPYNLASIDEGGNFGLLSALLITNFPTVKLTYSNADFSTFSRSWNESVTGNLTLFGFIKIGSFSQGAYGSTVRAGSDNSSFSVEFSASPQLISVPQYMKTAYVIAAAIANPGA